MSTTASTATCLALAIALILGLATIANAAGPTSIDPTTLFAVFHGGAFTPCPDGFGDNTRCLVVPLSVEDARYWWHILALAPNTGHYEWLDDWRHLDGTAMDSSIRVLMRFYEKPALTDLFPEPDELLIVGVVSLSASRTFVSVETRVRAP